MSNIAILASLALGSWGDGIHCAFGGSDLQAPPVAVTLYPVPSLKDRPGLSRVMVDVEGHRLRGNAQPIDNTSDDDVLIRAQNERSEFYTLGLRLDGAAVLHVGGQDLDETRFGRCEFHEDWFPGWLNEARDSSS
ncbi:MAG: hypothetical protein AAF871_11995 [Pseudomonadota bacterium]